jgi:hypothetical protein
VKRYGSSTFRPAPEIPLFASMTRVAGSTALAARSGAAARIEAVG